MTDSTQEVLLAPAKINLHLRVVRRLENGFHELDSVVAKVGLFDRLVVRDVRIESADHGDDVGRIEVRTNAAGIPDGKDNLVYRAAAAFASGAGRSVSLRAEIEKTIPSGGGLGGGSSDAASVLAFLNGRMAEPLAPEVLEGIALAVGSDVPLFLREGPLRMQGTGEVLSPWPGSVPPDLVLCSDGKNLPTARVFEAFDALTSDGAISKELDPVVSHWRTLALFNDLEGAAMALHPGLALVRAQMQRVGLDAVTMTGSGSVYFGIAPDADRAQAMARDLCEVGLWARAVESLD